MKRHHFIILLLCYFGAVSGLVCFECQGDPNKCDASAATKLCQTFPNDPDSDQICSSLYTWSNGIANVVKGCKARKSCRTNESQDQSRCGSNDLNKSCQCCCEDDRCNGNIMGCAAPLECDHPTVPSNGIVTCETPLLLETVCNFSCFVGYELSGENTAKCYRNSETGKLGWDNIGQTCEVPVRCQPALVPPFNGNINCRNQRRAFARIDSVGAECVFSCNTGYKLSRHSSISTCQRNGLWTRQSPQCVPLQCPRFQDSDHRWHVCSFSNSIGSTCQFHCDRGYKVIGSNTTTCTFQNGPNERWTNDPPLCQPDAVCHPPLSHPINGRVACSDSNFEGSICSTTCNYGYDIANSFLSSISTTCVLNDSGSVGSWTGTPPQVVCNRIKCYPEPASRSPLMVNCTDSNNANSYCTFACNKGYDLDDTTLDKVVSICYDDADGDDIGIWTLYPLPTCSPIACDPIPENHANGHVVCSNGYNLGSTCEIRCNAHYDLIGTSERTTSTTCERSSGTGRVGQWTNTLPQCVIISCPLPKIPANGSMSCTDGNVISSKCEFTCDLGYELRGVHILACLDRRRDGDEIGEWSADFPTCERRYCPDQGYDRSKLTRQCQSQNEAGQVPTGASCSYSCSQKGQYLQTPTQKSTDYIVTCLDSKRWSRGAPRCSVIKCESLLIPESGSSISCTKDNFYGSVCDFTCKPSYRMSHSRSLTCQSDGNTADGIGKWTDTAPTCLLEPKP